MFVEVVYEVHLLMILLLVVNKATKKKKILSSVNVFLTWLSQ